MRRLLVMAAFIVMLGVGSAADEAANPPSASGQDVVAEVDGLKITRQEYCDRLERLPYTDPATGQQNEAGAAVLERLIKEALILKLAGQEEVTPTEQQIQERMEQTMKTPGFEAQMKASGYTIEYFKERMRVEQAAFNIQTKGITVTNAEAREFYGKNNSVPPFTTQEQAMVGALFLKNKADTEKAQALLKKGVDFGTIAGMLSQDPVSAKQGGRLARGIVRGDPNIPTDIQNLVFSTKVDECSKPIPSGDRGSTVIFKILSHQPKKIRPFSEFQYLIKQRLAVEKGINEKIDINKKLEEFRQTVKIDVSIERYKAYIMSGISNAEPPDVLQLPVEE
ncbi:MAG TPA: peptidyl-prolyl cis-trans isomerase [Armatimonadota bacterium]|nr:peptidyl-prolyl cis-trans isomerase [Armatimonadota bacterium]